MAEQDMAEAWTVDPRTVKKTGKLGKGSSGDVHLATDVSGKSMALKTVPITLQANDVESLVNQLKELYSSRHPNVTAFYGAAYDDKANQIMIVFEYMDLKSIKDILQRTPNMPEEIVGNCAMQCVKGLHYLHKERRIIHRDIKPSNILVNSVGEFKITDFGMSKELSSALSAGQTWIGTNQYMSPERVGGLDYSFNADVWSLGLLLYQCATGHQPYHGSNTFELLDQIVDGEPPALPAGTFTNEAIDFVALCLRKSEQQRPGCDFLVSHPFLKKHEKSDVVSWLSTLGDGGAMQTD